LLAEKLRENLAKVFRARSLIGVASRFEGERYRGGVDVDVDVKVLLRKHASAAVEVIPASRGELVFRPGNLISFQVRNDSPSTPVDVCLLIVGTDFRIHAFYPKEHELGKSLDPGQTLVTPPGEITEKPPFGPECLVVIAVPVKNPPFDCAALVQDGLPRAGDRAAQLVRPPLQELLERAMFGTGDRSGLEQSVADQYAFRILTWRTEPR
jgi:hypothetical protein